MKYLLVMAVVALGIWLWRQDRSASRPSAAPPKPRPPQQIDQMVVCRHCGVHLPQSEAIKGQLGHYCGPEHQRLAGE